MVMTTTALADDGWKLRVNKQNIKVYVTKLKNSSLHSFRAVTVLNTNIRSLVNLMRDINSMEKWLETCSNPRVIEEPDEASRIIHMKNKSPFPLIIGHRDLVVLQQFRRESDKVVMVDIIDKSDKIPPDDNHIRGEYNGHWKFTDIGNQQIEVEYFGLASPEGDIPTFVVNRVAEDVPYRTLKKLRKMLHKRDTAYNTLMQIDSLSLEK